MVFKMVTHTTGYLVKLNMNPNIELKFQEIEIEPYVMRRPSLKYFKNAVMDIQTCNIMI